MRGWTAVLFLLVISVPGVATATQDPAPVQWKPCADQPLEDKTTVWCATSGATTTEIRAEVEPVEPMLLGEWTTPWEHSWFIVSPSADACSHDNVLDALQATPEEGYVCVPSDKPRGVTLVLPLSGLADVDNWLGAQLSYHSIPDDVPLSIVVYDSVSASTTTLLRDVVGTSRDVAVRGAVRDLLAREHDWGPSPAPGAVVDVIGVHLASNHLAGPDRAVVMVYDQSAWPAESCIDCQVDFENATAVLPASQYTILLPGPGGQTHVREAAGFGSMAIFDGTPSKQTLRLALFSRYELVRAHAREGCSLSYQINETDAYDQGVETQRTQCGMSSSMGWFVGLLIFWYALGVIAMMYVWLRRRR